LKFAKRGWFTHHYWFVWGDAAIQLHRFVNDVNYDAFVRDGLRAVAISKGEA
jgi:hypothetical protein